MLVKEGVQVELLPELMETDVAAIWVKLGVKGRKPLILSGIYREHRFLDQDDIVDGDTVSEEKQMERWRGFVRMWVKAARKYEVVVVGDVNLDYLRWETPDRAKVKMVDLVKEEIETLGFYQLVEGMTRCWNAQPDSLIDHCWSNVPQKLVYHKNVVRAFSDHNLIVENFRTKDRLENRHDIVKRLRKNMDISIYKSNIAQIDWTEVYESTVMNSTFVDKISKVLDDLAPIKKLQRRNYKSWVIMN